MCLPQNLELFLIGQPACSFITGLLWHRLQPVCFSIAHLLWHKLQSAALPLPVCVAQASACVLFRCPDTGFSLCASLPTGLPLHPMSQTRSSHQTRNFARCTSPPLSLRSCPRARCPAS